MTLTTSASTSTDRIPDGTPDPGAGEATDLHTDFGAATDAQHVDARVDDWTRVLDLPAAPRRLRALAAHQITTSTGFPGGAW